MFWGYPALSATDTNEAFCMSMSKQTSLLPCLSDFGLVPHMSRRRVILRMWVSVPHVEMGTDRHGVIVQYHHPDVRATTFGLECPRHERSSRIIRFHLIEQNSLVYCFLTGAALQLTTSYHDPTITPVLRVVSPVLHSNILSQ